MTKIKFVRAYYHMTDEDVFTYVWSVHMTDNMRKEYRVKNDDSTPCKLSDLPKYVQTFVQKAKHRETTVLADDRHRAVKYY